MFKGLRNLGKLPADVRQFVRSPVLLRITKANKRSNVHRPVQMDTVAIKTFDHKGQVAGERLFIGLFTSVAYARSPRDIPILREKVAHVISRSGFRTGSHDGKALLHDGRGGYGTYLHARGTQAWTPWRDRRRHDDLRCRASEHYRHRAHHR